MGSFEFNLHELAGSPGRRPCPDSSHRNQRGDRYFGAYLAVLAERRVTERQLSSNMGVMNVILSFFGGMPLCYGAGGLAGQYYFGARTGGANVIEGLIEIFLGLFLAGSIAATFAAFPMAIVGAMMLLVGIGLVKFSSELRPNRELLPVAATVLGSVVFNMAVDFVVGLAVHYLLFRKPKGLADAR